MLLCGKSKRCASPAGELRRKRQAKDFMGCTWRRSSCDVGPRPAPFNNSHSPHSSPWCYATTRTGPLNKWLASWRMMKTPFEVPC